MAHNFKCISTIFHNCIKLNCINNTFILDFLTIKLIRPQEREHHFRVRISFGHLIDKREKIPHVINHHRIFHQTTFSAAQLYPFSVSAIFSARFIILFIGFFLHLFSIFVFLFFASLVHTLSFYTSCWFFFFLQKSC